MKAYRERAKPLIATGVLSAVLAAPLTCLAQVGPTTPAPGTGATPYRDAMFRHLDSDHDGFISRHEALRQPRFLEAFGQADDNRDGRISDAEYIKARAIYDRQRAASYARDSLITAKVKAALVKDPVVSALDVSVETAYGEVLLSGFVDNDEQVRRAREVAAGIEGVKGVHANLIVKG